MASTITDAYARQFADNVIIRAQQKGSRLVMTAGQIEEMVSGERVSFIPVAKTAAVLRTTLVAPTPSVNLQFAQRWAEPSTYDWATQLDKTSFMKMVANPESPAIKSGANAIGRAWDDLIITALNGTAKTGKNADGTATLGSGQKVAVSGTDGLTLAKLLAAIQILNAAEIDEDERYFLYTAVQQTDALGISQLTSMDYAIHQAIREGKPASLLGAQWIRTERLTNSSTTRFCPFYGSQALGWATWSGLETRVTERDDLNFAVQPWLSGTAGAVRVEDEAMVQVACYDANAT